MCPDIQRHGHARVHLRMQINPETQPASSASEGTDGSHHREICGQDTGVQRHTDCEATNPGDHTHTTRHSITDRDWTTLPKSRDAMRTPPHVPQVSIARPVRPCRACGRSTGLRVKGPSSKPRPTSNLLGDLEQGTSLKKITTALLSYNSHTIQFI